MVEVGQVWLYRREDPSRPPVVHVISRVEGEICESTSVFTDDGAAHEGCTISGAGCGGVGIEYMLAGRDSVGTWTRLV